MYSVLWTYPYKLQITYYTLLKQQTGGQAPCFIKFIFGKWERETQSEETVKVSWSTVQAFKLAQDKKDALQVTTPELSTAGRVPAACRHPRWSLPFSQ